MPTELAARTHVVHVIPHGDAGGMGLVAALLDGGMRRRGISSAVIDLQHELDLRGAAGRKLSPALLRLTRDVLGRWRRSRPRAVIAHTAVAGAVTLSIAVLARVPVRVLVVHANRPLLGAAKTFLSRAMWRSRVATRIVFVGEAAASSFGSFGQAPRTEVIRNGVRLPAAEPLPEGLAGRAAGRIPVACLGRLVPEKAFDLAVAACRQARVPVSLTVCGDGPERAKLEELAEGMDSVRFLGNIGRSTLRAVLEDADVCLFPSRVEGLPLALVEAAQTGVAIIARDDPVNREVVADAAIYVRGDRVEDWTEALDRVLLDSRLMRDLQARSVERAAMFDPELMVEKYVRLVGA